ncbi:serine/threonine protein kinase [Pyrococcus yayanosii]|uniref:Serine/threonine protein kinase n=1 Tax=Pyrococcus yayanosii (strain CH1 / JCM 16557) TaxID=529709 RepID=F8AF07_PYRYC|nr:serine/threonine protein kinase [Pyrococcus yayanosii]AEH24844.1 hypothetical protein PYCH_11630 [Pyrococcus yayanosii CH1]
MKGPLGMLVSEEDIKELRKFLRGEGIELLEPYSKGTTSVVFKGMAGKKPVVIKWQRRDSPRRTLWREARILEMLKGTGVTAEPVLYAEVLGREILVREFLEGKPIIEADVEKKHLLRIAEKAHLLDVMGVDHGQIQGGKHIIIGEDVWIIDFEKASTQRKPRNLTSAMAMIFLSNNIVSRRVLEKFGIGDDFRKAMRETLREYKRTMNPSKVFELLASL